VSAPYWQHERATLYGGDALPLLTSLPDASVDTLITDPPYSSGGMVRGDRTNATGDKYKAPRGGRPDPLEDFTGDNRDQRGYAFWVNLWLGECLRVVKPGGTACLFTDWRQLPTTTDVVQAAGWIWRGIVPWSKPGLRPMSGRFRAECEYVVWASNGPMPWDFAADALPGFFQCRPPNEREHLTQKPVSVMRDLVKIAPKGGTVLDPFMGAGTTGIAAVIEGRNFIGAEITEHYQRIARERIEASIVGYRDDGRQLALGMLA
jgi:site-specific DNA-methyltransferase (adenine-specific)